ncbi:hypothetical protein GCM10011297_22480 [Bacterioplanes sanyensis]|uniref:substrate-binding periplasmic protein n=1 Tax=Bacterioplanes sanyensis TaxID=1249553 RepID=UPI00167A557A|nr:transporter substrate-binding domain-containing protein [Bacterioplanes sanyensis]GGY49156.1 hypothetical protein GCM10011297_22480 [Bacterioplanes sanyensis]
MIRLIALAVTAIVSLPLQAQTLTFCGDSAGWPPYTYEENGVVKGYDVDVLKAILEPQGITVDVQMLPWKRCLQDTDNGKIHAALSASANDERRKKYRLTEYYYTVQPSYIYVKERFPGGVQLTASEALKQHKICGLRGYNYDGFGLSSEKVDRDTNNFKQLFQKTKAGRCDLILARYEILVGFALMGENYLTDEWGYNAIPGIEGDKFYMLVSRNIPDSEAVEKKLSDGIKQLRSEGKLEALLKPYLN